MELKEPKNVKTVRKIKKRIVFPVLVFLTAVYVFSTSNVQEEVASMFIGGVASFSLLTIIFFMANMLKDQTRKEAAKPYVAVFGLLLVWSAAFALLRIVVRF